MKKLIVCFLLLFTTTAFAEVDKAQMDSFKKEARGLREAIGDAVSSVVPGRSYVDLPKATYLDGYGAVITLEAALGPTRSPFSSPATPEQVRKTFNERRTQITQKIEALLKKSGAMQSIGPNESVTVVLYLLNSNPADVPDLPSQILFTLKKQDPTQVIVREF
ncbi:MAG TPA: hypothetical protein VGK48_01555 [Terriglobia bacterium]|jgi:hypothetical protein